MPIVFAMIRDLQPNADPTLELQREILVPREPPTMLN